MLHAAHLINQPEKAGQVKLTASWAVMGVEEMVKEDIKEEPLPNQGLPPGSRVRAVSS